jgi:nitrogen fixation NifU-like protein
MDDLRELYQEMILDHNKHPRNWGVLEGSSHHAEGFNPLCGDHYQLYLDIEDGVIKDIAFEGSGCAISKSSASIMTELLKGKHVDEAKQYFDQVHELLTTDAEANLTELGKLAVFAGVRDYPSRVKCASLAWHTLQNALAGKQQASTE